MFDHLFIAEKANLAKDVAKARARQTGQEVRTVNGVIMVGNDAFTNVSGHFYDTAPLDHYDPALKAWSWKTLPALPDLKRLPVEGKENLLRNIKALTEKATKIVNVGDAAREGQLIIDEVLEEFGLDPHGPNVLRLWIQDMTETKIVEYLNSMQPNAKYKDLFESAVARQSADFYLGMNMTRAYSLKAREAGAEGVLSIGRVQTPTVALVVQRDLEIENFKAVDHYGTTVIFDHQNGSYSAKWVVPSNHPALDLEKRLLDKSVAEAIAAKVSGQQGTISSIETKGKSQSPPLPFNLTSLQKECSNKLGLSADRTLEIAQELYDKYKVASYPRTDAKHLPTEMREKDAPTILSNLKGVEDFAEIAGKANPSLKSPAWDNSKIEDHYGIVPTLGANRASVQNLPGELRQVFAIIAKRFIAQFHPDHRYDATTVNTLCEGETFRANGKVVTHVGWKFVYGAEADDDEDEKKQTEKDGPNQALPKMVKGDGVLAKSAKTDASKTKPPQHFTDVTLIEAMERIDLFVTDPEIKKKLKETSGLGKSSTRTAIVKLMIQREYVKTDEKSAKGKKYLKSTPKARSLIAAVDKRLSDPGLTAIWEDALDGIAKGSITRDRFIDGLKNTIRGMIDIVARSEIKIASTIKPLKGHGETCDKCGKGKMYTKRIITKKSPKGEMVLACSAYSREPGGCSNIKFQGTEHKPLPGHGTPCPKCSVGKLMTRGYKPPDSKEIKTFLACDRYSKTDPNACDYVHRQASSVPALPNQGQACPKCQAGKLVTRAVTRDGPNKGRRFYACSTGTFTNGVSGGCDHFEWGEGAPAGGGGRSAGSSRNSSSFGKGKTDQGKARVGSR